MKDNLQNIADLIGALAEDIETIKAKLDVKDTSDKDEAVKKLAMKLEPVIRFFGKVAAKARLYNGTVAGNPSRQGDKRNKAVVEQNSRWLAQEPLRMGWHRLYARVSRSFYRQLGTMA